MTELRLQSSLWPQTTGRGANQNTQSVHHAAHRQTSVNQCRAEHQSKTPDQDGAIPEFFITCNKWSVSSHPPLPSAVMFTGETGAWLPPGGLHRHFRLLLLRNGNSHGMCSVIVYSSLVGFLYLFLLKSSQGTNTETHPDTLTKKKLWIQRVMYSRHDFKKTTSCGFVPCYADVSCVWPAELQTLTSAFKTMISEGLIFNLAATAGSDLAESLIWLDDTVILLASPLQTVHRALSPVTWQGDSMHALFFLALLHASIWSCDIIPVHVSIINEQHTVPFVCRQMTFLNFSAITGKRTTTENQSQCAYATSHTANYSNLFNAKPTDIERFIFKATNIWQIHPSCSYRCHGCISFLVLTVCRQEEHIISFPGSLETIWFVFLK